jgi:hypothetical protein
MRPHGPRPIQRDGRHILKYAVGTIPAGATADDLEPAYLIHEPANGPGNPFRSRVFATELTSPLIFEFEGAITINEPLANPYPIATVPTSTS